MDLTEKYEALLPQFKGLISDETNIVGILANVSALLQSTFADRFFWTGFYLKQNDTTFTLGPFQGTVACYSIPFGKGVCGTTWKEGKTLIVDDVEKFPGHIACSSLSRSEIVVPLYDSKHNFYGVLDIDSTEVGTFNEVDKKYLEQMMEILMIEIEYLL